MNLKFRAWCKPLNKFIPQDDFAILNDGSILTWDWHSDYGKCWGSPDHPFKDDEIIIQQWTGLVDANGKEIYDGDIILAPLYGTEGKDFDKMVVKFWRAKFTLDSSSGCYGGVAIGNINSIYLSVIGNIFENPELL